MFVYPFLFEAESFEARAQSVERAAVGGRKRELLLWAVQPFPEDDLLEHVRRYLNPPAGARATARLWQLDPNAMRNWLRTFTCGKDARWTLQMGRRKPIEFQLSAIQLGLFRTGVGFLVLRAQPLSDSLADWLDFLYAFRFAYGQRGVKVETQLKEGDAPVQGVEHIGQLIEDLLQQAGFGAGEAARRARELFVPGQLLPFAVIYADGEDLAAKPMAELLYRVRRFFPSERLIHPSEADLRPEHPDLLPYAERMWFTFSL
ncbi:MAG: hypothetical protein NZL85_02915, partial [Fimbriimonadales bacterium]|nr:hypothetical protein [Fimbriimonadales bacterium]